MTTVMDIAADANVSTATVSRVLNGHPSVAEPTRAKVLDSINRLGYRMNGVARSLRASSTRSFGLVLPNIRNPFFAEVARAVEVVAMARGVSVFLGNADENVEKESRYLDVLLDKRVDAILISPAGSASPLLTEAIARAGVPGVGGVLQQLDQEPAVVLPAEQSLRPRERPGVADVVLVPVLGPFGDGVLQER